MANYLDRTKSLIGEDSLKNISSKTILIVGLGGVGGTALNALMRSGFKHFIIMDFDKVDITNLNRQIMYDLSDVGQFKVDVCEKRIKAINENIEVNKINDYLDEKTINKLDDFKIDFIVDAIDKIPSKIELIKYSFKKNIPLISSLGMGKRLNVNNVEITNLNKTSGDPLARKLRYECKQLGLTANKINVVFSKEEPLSNDKEIASMIMTPSTAGLLIAEFIIKNYLK